MSRLANFFRTLFSFECRVPLSWRVAPEAGFFGMSAGAVALTATALKTGVDMYGASQARKNSNKAFDAAAKNQIDIASVIEQARTNQADNLKNSIALERQYLPGTAALRGVADTMLGDLASGNTMGQKVRDTLLAGLTQTNPLLVSAADSILSQLKLGGKLDAETQAAVTKGALEHGGSAGISGSGAQRGLVARDLGLTSLQLIQQRQGQALTAGQTMANDLAQRAQLGISAAGQDDARALNIAQLIDRRALPTSGIDSGSLVDLITGKTNAQNQLTLNRAAVTNQNDNAMYSGISSLIGGVAGLYGSAGGAAGYDTSANGSYNDMYKAMYGSPPPKT